MADPKRLETYTVTVDKMVVNVEILMPKDDVVPHYKISILNISPITTIILDKIKEEFVSQVTAGTIEVVPREKSEHERIRETFRMEIEKLIKKYFPNIDRRNMELLIEHVMKENIGLGNLEILLGDKNLEEIVVNNSKECVWVFHRRYGWMKTNIRIISESRIRHYATIIGRDSQKEITMLKPLLDARLRTGDRVNATLHPVSTKGNTITIRKFHERPWTITDFIKTKTMNYEVAAFLWLAVQYELSIIISGGTSSGKTSALNVISNFFPPNQRIISLEQTREIVLPSNLQWVPFETRAPNPEGKGEVSMLDLVINSLRMRPDRLVVGEIRRQSEAEVLFEAMHTGHSVYATLHANNAHETIVRLTNPPIDVPKMMIPAVSMILVQVLNRRSGVRRTMQLAEVMDSGDTRTLYQLDFAADKIRKVREPTRIYETLNLYTGLTVNQVNVDLSNKIKILKWFVKNDITDVDKIGMTVGKYYTGRLGKS